LNLIRVMPAKGTEMTLTIPEERIARSPSRPPRAAATSAGIAAAPPRHWLADQLPRLARGGIVLLGLAAVWQGVVLLLKPPSFMFPGLDRVLAALVERPDLWRVHAVTTFLESLLGLAAGAGLGALLALAMSFLPPTRRLVLPVMVVSQAFPVFALAPLLVLWFGYGLGSKVVMATIAIFFPVASAFHDGLVRTDPRLLDLATLYRARNWQQVLLLRLPAAIPSLVSGLRLAAVYAPLGALFGEWVGASSGLGYAMLHANGRAETDVVFAALILLALMSVLLRTAVDLVTRGWAAWAPETAT
jgi:putative hydroxymethylpyrimidine transport system permease protein